MNIADRIQYLRKTKGISQEDLANELGVSRQAISKWESNQSIPDIDKIILLSNYFKVTTDYLLKGIEDKKLNIKTLYYGFILIFATIAGLWSFTANRFNYNECFFIILAGASIGFGISLIIELVYKFLINKNKTY